MSATTMHLHRAVRDAINAMEHEPTLTASNVAERALALLPEPAKFGAREPLRRIAADMLRRMFDPLSRLG